MLSDTEAHVVLGVAVDADAATIKKAFRRLAMRWHPDRNPDPGAVEQFKRLRAAHDYMLARDAEPETGPEAEPDAAEEPIARGPDRSQALDLSLDEAFGGCEKDVPIEALTPCGTCDGSGRMQLAHGRLCRNCHGSGRVRTDDGLAACGECHGRGYSSQIRCSDCDGSGTRRAVTLLRVKVPPGMLADEELRLEGKGDPAPHDDGRPGDLRLRIRLTPHPLFTLSGRDLLLTRPVNAFTLLAGGTLRVPLPCGSLEIEVPAGSGEPREIRIENAGFPGRGDRPAGALRITLQPLFPPAPGPTLIARYRQLEAEIAGNPELNLPRLRDWERSWLDGL